MNTGSDERPLDTDAATQLETLVEGGDSGDGIPTATDEVLELGQFRLIRELGQGGMGRVFLALQTEPVERHVALKVVRKRVLNRRTLARFEVERQILAQMQHPAIAQVHDAGTTPQGYPWFAMEYVDGEPLHQFCTRHRLSLGDRLDLFVRICHGVQHAHQRGIIHRDLKPANILVTEVDGVPQPKIIDFGIATAAHSDEDDKTTAHEVAGTPQYMSPEQFADGNGIIDTRSDVYSLGVILHELLIDSLPIDRAHFRDRKRLKFSELPHGGTLPTPSTRLSGDTGQREQIAARRAMRYRSLRKHLRGDLDAIVLKALELDRDRRYETPAQLAEDIHRSRLYQPVHARDWTTRYRLGRFVRRHAVALGSASAVLLALIAGLTAATLGMLEAQRQFHIAETRSAELEQVAAFQQSMLEEVDPALMGFGIIDALRGQIAQGLERARESGASTETLSGFEAMMTHVNATDLAREVIDEFVLQRAAVSIERDFADQPLLQADLFLSVFQVYRAVGQGDRLPALGERVLELRLSQLDEEAIEVLEARRQLGKAYFATADYERSIAELELVLARLDGRRDDHRLLQAAARDDLALARVEHGDSAGARALARENIEQAAAVWAEDDPARLAPYGTMGYVLARSGQIEDALEYFQRQLDGQLALLDDSDPSIARSMINVSAALGHLGRLEESLEVNRAAVQRLERTHGRRHPDTLRAMANLATTLHRVGQSEPAIEILEDAVELRGEVMGPHHPLTLRAMLNLASVYTHTQRHDEALALIEVVAEQRSLQLGDHHLDTLMARELEANIHLNQGRFESAVAIVEPVYRARIEQLGQDHGTTLDSAWILGRALLESGDADTAEPLLLAALEHTNSRLGSDHEATLTKALAYYQSLLARGREDQARQVRREHLFPLDQADPADLDDRLSGLYETLHQLSE